MAATRVALPGETVVTPTAEEAASALTATLVEHLRARLTVVEKVHVALSGGSSAKLLASALKATPGLSAQEWARAHLWMVDERCVADDDPNLNFRLIRDSIAVPLSIPVAHLHPMPVLRANGDREYERAFAEALADRPANDRRFDAVVLGMGPDGHTASLFPQSPALDERHRLVVFNDGDRVVAPRPRMTLTYPAICSAHLVELLVTGTEKHDALAQTAARHHDFHDWPVSGLSPGNDTRMVWFIDQAAAPARAATPAP